MTNETDRELLELAAKAAGYVPATQDSGSPFVIFEEDDARDWNPLNDVTDRYRLARHLGLCINFTECTVWKRLPDHSLVQEYWGGDCGDEAHAIVRAAAEIGKAML